MSESRMEDPKEFEEDFHSQSHISTIAFPPSEVSRRTSINDLPVELLSHIFKFGGGDSEDEGGNEEELQLWDGSNFYRIGAHDPVGKHPSPSFRISVLLVCRHWYHVALSTPSLWTTLRLATWDSFEPLQTMFARSRDLPLYVDVHLYIETELADIDVQRLGSWGQKPRPCLEQRYITLFADLAPRLRRLRFSQSQLSWSEPWISSLSNLTTLELGHPGESVWPSWEQLMSMLRSAPFLKKLVLASAGPIDTDDSDDDSTVNEGTRDSHPPVPLLNLTELVLTGESHGCAAGLFSRLSMPALKSLSLDLFYSPILGPTSFIELLDDSDNPPAATSLRPEGPLTFLSRLEHLRIVNLPPGDNPAMLEMLYCGLHNLKSLQIWLSSHVHHKVERNLDHPRYLLPYAPPGEDNITVRLPRLEVLVICGHHINVTYILNAVERRKNAGFPLKSLYIQTSDGEESESFAECLESFSLS